MIEVAALTAGNAVPSTRFRVRQHVAGLVEYGLHVTEHRPLISKYAEWPGLGDNVPLRYKFPATGVLWAAKCLARMPALVSSWRSDVTWLSRDLLVGLPTLEPLLGKPLVLDVDDAVWCTWPWGGYAARRTARHAAVVIAGNQIIAEWFSDHGATVEIVPTAVDIGRFAPRARRDESEARVLGWIGSGSNLPYLASVAPALGAVMARYPEVRLRVVTDHPPQDFGIDSDRIDWIRWSADNEGDDVRAMDIGLMPMPDTPWTRGKCALKMLQYLGCALPVVVAPVGMNADILSAAEVGFGARTHDEWVDALGLLLSDQRLCARLGGNGRMLVEQMYSTERITHRLAKVFLSLR